jgi:glycosyltransferase involved in cell wall biosynthesis
MFVSVVIATRNRQMLLAETLKALAAQRWPRHRFEIIVAYNGSTDATRSVVAKAAATAGAPSIAHLFVGQPGKSYAVNAALQAARGELIAFTDDDVVPDPNWIAALAGAAEDSGADFIAGRILPNWEVAPPAWMSPALFGVLAIPDNGLVRCRIAIDEPAPVMTIGANMAVRASVIARVGGLRTDLGKLEGTLRTGEDHEFFLRLLHAGCSGVYEPAALVQHFVPASRLRRAYFREWLYQNGRDVAIVESTYQTPVTMLMGVPRYLWKQMLHDAVRALGASLRRDRAQRFASLGRLLWFAGFVRERWLGGADAGAGDHRLAPPAARVLP